MLNAVTTREPKLAQLSWIGCAALTTTFTDWSSGTGGPIRSVLANEPPPLTIEQPWSKGTVPTRPFVGMETDMVATAALNAALSPGLPLRVNDPKLSPPVVHVVVAGTGWLPAVKVLELLGEEVTFVPA